MSEPEEPPSNRTITFPRSEPQEPIPKEARRPSRIRGVIYEAVRSELRFFSGPLPPPDVLIHYNEAFPGCAERIVQMAESEAQHRHDMEKVDLVASVGLAKRGQIIGAILAGIFLLGGIYLLANDKSPQGYVLIATAAATFGGAFIYDRYQQHQTETPAPDAKSTTEKNTDLVGPL